MAKSEGAQARVGPLGGVRVLELGVLLAGPFTARMLGDFGAEVIKVESPGVGDPLREWGRQVDGIGLLWSVMSRNKRLVTLDLRREGGQQVFRRLAATADVVVENFRPGTLERWGLGPERLQEANRGLVVTRVSGYGQTGPYAARAGFASAGEAMGGLRYINGHPGEAPPRMGISLGDSLAAMFAAQGTLMALYHRAAHGGAGQVVDASILESCFSMLESTVPDYARFGLVREPSGTSLAGVAPSNVYLSGDGKWMVIAANAPTLFERLCRVIGRPELVTDGRFATHAARGRNAAELDAIIGAWVAERDAAAIDAAMNGAGIVCGPVYSIADIFADPHYQARGLLQPVPDPVLGEVVMPGVVPVLSETPGGIAWSGRRGLGADNEAVYGELLGLGPAELAGLKAEGVL
ncbi:MAG: CoA transferase [Candidatus Dormibacteraeota bacterium]|nr:CoA transferase [Candidatus Dormibacteraeota bacterium]